MHIRMYVQSMCKDICVKTSHVPCVVQYTRSTRPPGQKKMYPLGKHLHPTYPFEKHLPPLSFRVLIACIIFRENFIQKSILCMYM